MRDPQHSPGAGEASVIETARLTLRWPEPDDVPAITAGIGEWDVACMLARVPFPYGRGDAASFVALAREQNAAGENLHLVIERDGEVVGGIGLHGLPVVADFGYWLARPHWGAGLATEAARAVLAHAFEVVGAARVPSGVFFDNPASLKVQEKLGFTRTGTRLVHSLARGEAVEHIDTVLTRARFEETSR